MYIQFVHVRVHVQIKYAHFHYPKCEVDLLLFSLYLEPINFDSDSSKVEKLLSFGRELQSLFTEVTQDRPNRTLQKLLQDSFSLLAYTDPRNSPVGYLLEPAHREPVAAALNSAILSEKMHYN